MAWRATVRTLRTGTLMALWLMTAAVNFKGPALFSAVISLAFAMNFSTAFSFSSGV